MTRRDKIFALAKGFRGRAKNCYRLAIRRVEKGLQYAYKSRKLKKRIARQEWITQIAGGCREHGMVYSRLIQGMNLSRIAVDRKMLSVLAQTEPYSFRAIIEEAKSSLRTAVLRQPPLVLTRRDPTLRAEERAAVAAPRKLEPGGERLLPVRIDGRLLAGEDEPDGGVVLEDLSHTSYQKLLSHRM